MAVIRTPKRDALLMHGMADKLHADLEGAIASGDVTRHEAATMSAQCRACTKHDECILWMLEHDSGAEVAPGYCLNAERLATLRA